MSMLIAPDGALALHRDVIKKITYSTDKSRSVVKLFTEVKYSNHTGGLLTLNFRDENNRAVDIAQAKKTFKRLIQWRCSRNQDMLNLSEESFDCEVTCECPEDSE